MTNIRAFAAGLSPVLETDDFMASGTRVRLETATPATRRAYRAGFVEQVEEFNALVRRPSPRRRRARRERGEYGPQHRPIATLHLIHGGAI